jgi:hypothetical protein
MKTVSANQNIAIKRRTAGKARHNSVSQWFAGFENMSQMNRALRERLQQRLLKIGPMKHDGAQVCRGQSDLIQLLSVLVEPAYLLHHGAMLMNDLG